MNEVEQLRDEVNRLQTLISTPQTERFVEAVCIEAAFQQERWGSAHDAGKTAWDWFWLIGYLAQKAAAAHATGDLAKALHHTISTAAALCNWHRALLGEGEMRPGLSAEKHAQIDGVST